MSRVHGGSYDRDPAVEARLDRVRLQIATAVRRRRAALKLTQEEVAEKVGCAATYYQKLEGGKCTPSLRFLSHLSIVLRCSLIDLFEPATRRLSRRSTLKKAAN